MPIKILVQEHDIQSRYGQVWEGPFIVEIQGNILMVSAITVMREYLHQICGLTWGETVELIPNDEWIFERCIFGVNWILWSDQESGDQREIMWTLYNEKNIM